MKQNEKARRQFYLARQNDPLKERASSLRGQDQPCLSEYLTGFIGKCEDWVKAELAD